MCVRIKHNRFPTTGFTDRFEFTNGTTAGYDNLNRLLNFSRGTLNGGNNTISSPTATRSWSLDAQGNWAGNAAGQPYTINNQNQITLASGSPSATFGYDNDGNLTSRPAPAGSNASANDAFAYDAWDREAQFTRTFVSSGGSEIEVAANIDALGRRTQVVTTGTGGLGGVPLPTDDLYYSTSWQVLEDDNSKTANGGANTGFNQMQFVWSPTYVNDLVLRDRSTAGNGSFNERVYVQHDANHNVTAITNSSGVVQERFIYDPYGIATVLNPTTWASMTDTLNWQYMFQGGRYDSNSGLYTYQRREYDSTLGRWIQQDPAGDINGADLYQVEMSNPIRWNDAFGLHIPDEDRPPGSNIDKNGHHHDPRPHPAPSHQPPASPSDHCNTRPPLPPLLAIPPIVPIPAIPIIELEYESITVLEAGAGAVSWYEAVASGLFLIGDIVRPVGIAVVVGAGAGTLMDEWWDLSGKLANGICPPVNYFPPLPVTKGPTPPKRPWWNPMSIVTVPYP